jgi:hypothetical protein
MIFRAVFWIGLVSLLVPHEPDLGLGRPGAGTSPSSPALFAASGLSRTDMSCGSACAGGLGLLDLVQLDRRSIAAGLADVKAQIAADKRARAEHHKSI